MCVVFVVHKSKITPESSIIIDIDDHKKVIKSLLYSVLPNQSPPTPDKKIIVPDLHCAGATKLKSKDPKKRKIRVQIKKTE